MDGLLEVRACSPADPSHTGQALKKKKKKKKKKKPVKMLSPHAHHGRTDFLHTSGIIGSGQSNHSAHINWTLAI